MSVRVILCVSPSFIFFFFNDTATTEIYTLSLHDALPIFNEPTVEDSVKILRGLKPYYERHQDRKSTRLNSSHLYISYAVFCLKKQDNKTVQSSRDDVNHAYSLRPHINDQS